jgi:hypothetical protein
LPFESIVGESAVLSTTACFTGRRCQRIAPNPIASPTATASFIFNGSFIDADFTLLNETKMNHPPGVSN